MIVKKVVSVLLMSLVIVWPHRSAIACSMYKVTDDGKTMVGCNEDAWRTTSRIWFANSIDVNGSGACFTGSRKVGANKFTPQSGMNEEGLVFSRLTAYHPDKNLIQQDKKQIKNEAQYLTDILHTCITIDDVKNYIEAYDHSIFLDDVFIYIDKSGDYLIVEPYTMIKGNDPSYVLANFCPSLTSNQNARKQTRYKNGEDYLKANDLVSSLDFCRSVSEAMHVCRSRNGDGTLLTSVWDTQKGLVNLYFYHNYDSTVQFNIAKELELGDHVINIPSLFPTNPEYERLIEYKTPFNVNSLRVSLAILGGFMLLLSFLYLISYLKKRNTDKLNFVKLYFLGLNTLLVAYLFVLATNINIYYFDAPYQHHASDLISLSSYMPFVLLLLIIPISIYNIRYVKSSVKNMVLKASLVMNNIIYVVLIMAFGYWGLFDIIN